MNVWFSNTQALGNQLSLCTIQKTDWPYLAVPCCQNRVSSPQHPVLLSCVLLLLVLPLAGHLAGGSPLTCHTQHEVRSFTCLINKMKESLEGSDCIKDGEKRCDSGGTEWLPAAGCSRGVPTHVRRRVGPGCLNKLPPPGITTLFSAGCPAQSKC